MAIKKASSIVKSKAVTKVAKTPVKKTVNVDAPPASSKKAKKSLVASVLGVDGKASGQVTLPEELFGAHVNKALLAQAVRVYLANQREGGAKTKTRGEVEGSSRKIYKQKGTGRARHGTIRAPIFVGGGRAFGPRTHSFKLVMSNSMRHAALSSALSEKYADGDIVIMDGLETLEAKTKLVFTALNAASIMAGSVLLVVSKEAANLSKAARNIAHVDMLRAIDLHPYAVLTHSKILMTKKALEEAKKNFIK